MKNIPFRFVFLAMLLPVVAACGGGNNDSSPPDDSVSLKQGTLQGSILVDANNFQDRDSLLKMELKTGLFIRKYPGTDWEEDDGYHNQASFVLEPVAYKGDGFVLSVNSCRKRDGDIAINISCVVILDENAVEIGKFEILHGEIKAAKMSRNNDYIALIWEGNGSGNLYLEVRDRADNDNVLSKKVVNSASTLSANFDWLPDNRLVYYVRSLDDEKSRSITITTPYSAETETVMRIPSAVMEGYVSYISASPDGTQLAFNIITGESFVSTKAIPFVVNVDGTKLRQLAFSPDVDVSQTSLLKPKWSPDGRWILLRSGGVRLLDPPPLYSDVPVPKARLFAVPSDGAMVPVPLYEDPVDTPAILIRSNQRSVYHDHRDPSVLGDEWDKNWSYNWIN